MAYQWKLTPFYNKIIRSELEKEFIDYLYKNKGTILDLGCGNGWLSLKFAQKGMKVLGIDFSQSQIDAAEKLRIESGQGDVAFECHDLIHWAYHAHKHEFDSVLINAFLHHLPALEIKHILRGVSEVLKPGGRVYIYEPISQEEAREGKFFRIIATICIKGVGLMLKLPTWLNLWKASYKQLIEEGFTNCSPHEAPIDINLITESCRDSLVIFKIRGWHLYSLEFAMQVMFIADGLRNFYTPFIFLWYWVDKIMFRCFSLKNFSGHDRFVLLGIELEKRA
jgi:SAM-dependent methyltransferase